MATRLWERSVEKSYVVDSERAAIVREIFERHVAGYSMSRLARQLNARGVRGVKGGMWSQQRPRRCSTTALMRGFVATARDLHRQLDVFGVARVVRARTSDRIRRRSYYGSPSGRPSYLLSGLLVCGVCQGNLHYHSDKHRRVYECRAGQDQLLRCLGGQITGAIAEKLVLDAGTELQSLVRDQALAGVP